MSETIKTGDVPGVVGFLSVASLQSDIDLSRDKHHRNAQRMAESIETARHQTKRSSIHLSLDIVRHWYLTR